MFQFVYRHDLNPFIFEITSGVGIRWYGMAYLAGFAAAYFILSWRARVGRLELTDEQRLDLVALVALGAVLGARAGNVFLWNFDLFLEDPLFLLRIWEGGMSFHGGLLGGLLGLGWFAYRQKINFWTITDAGTFAVIPGLFFGRIANFINGELWGRPTSGDWGVIFPAVDELPRHPSQLYQALFEGPVLFLLLLFIVKFKPGHRRLSLGFLAGYGIFRFFVEFYRAPDPRTGFVMAGLTRGQIYSALMVVTSILLTLWFARKSE